MSRRASVSAHSPRRVVICASASVAIVTLVTTAAAGIGLLGRNSAVGGISITADGVVGPPIVQERNLFLNELRKDIKSPAGELGAPSDLRMISLRELAAACADALKNRSGQLPQEVRYLAGIQRIVYLFVYPEEHDIVLAGPGEGWKVDDNANIVGVTTGRPVLRLDDLLVALRSVEQARLGGITCSIDPTEAGAQALAKLFEQQRKSRTPVDPPSMTENIKQTFGSQLVTISGVPLTSHFARVLVAADYRMKRLAMNLEPAPVEGFRSYVDLISHAGGPPPRNVNPRWWLACNYQPLATSEDHLAWQLRGPGVKALTEDEARTAEGRVKGTGKASPAAQKWADLMTDKYESLSGKDAVFCELRNLMDLCVVAALLEKEGLWNRAGLDVPLLRDPQSELKVELWYAPKMVPPEVSFTRAGKSWIVTASGGVQLTPWQVASNVDSVPQVGEVRQKAAPKSKTLWWQ